MSFRRTITPHKLSPLPHARFTHPSGSASHRSNSTSTHSAFTLLELLTVIAIITILAGIILTAGERAIHRAKVTKTRSLIDSLAIALVNFERDMGSFDVEVGGLPFPTGMVQNDEQRETLVKILAGKKVLSDGTCKIASNVRQHPKWNGPYFDPNPKQAGLLDAWGKPLMLRIKHGNWDRHMRYRPDSFEIWSFGPNQTNEVEQPTFGDDITNWN